LEKGSSFLFFFFKRKEKGGNFTFFFFSTELQSFYLEQNRVFKAGSNSAVKRRKTPCMLQHGIMEQDQVGSRAYFVLVFSREQIELIIHPTGDD